MPYEMVAEDIMSKLRRQIELLRPLLRKSDASGTFLFPCSVSDFSSRKYIILLCLPTDLTDDEAQVNDTKMAACFSTSCQF